QIDNPQTPAAGGSLEFTPTSGPATTLDLADAIPTTQGVEATFDDGAGNQALASIIVAPPVVTKLYWYFYDANGNVSDIYNVSDAIMAAHYEYEPFGKKIVAVGPYADENSIRFSTKWWDAETGKGYWGMRTYDSDRGRWTTRDPENEA